jgi:hypothetical protein
MTNIRRMWINQPSTLQRYHALHGTNVLALRETKSTYRVYFLSGSIISQQIGSDALSSGWRDSPASNGIEIGDLVCHVSGEHFIVHHVKEREHLLCSPTRWLKLWDCTLVRKRHECLDTLDKDPSPTEMKPPEEDWDGYRAGDISPHTRGG